MELPKKKSPVPMFATHVLFAMLALSMANDHQTEALGMFCVLLCALHGWGFWFMYDKFYETACESVRSANKLAYYQDKNVELRAELADYKEHAQYRYDELLASKNELKRELDKFKGGGCKPDTLN